MRPARFEAGFNRRRISFSHRPLAKSNAEDRTVTIWMERNGDRSIPGRIRSGNDPDVRPSLATSLVQRPLLGYFFRMTVGIHIVAETVRPDGRPTSRIFQSYGRKPKQAHKKKRIHFHRSSRSIDATAAQAYSQSFSILIGQFIIRISITFGTTGGIANPFNSLRSGITLSQAG
jgi:hypothetical protein